jgi:hypothetical protein
MGAWTVRGSVQSAEMTGMAPTEGDVERPVEQAPEWVRAIMVPGRELTPLREEVLRFLAGEPTGVRVVETSDDLFPPDAGDADDSGGQGAA